MSLKADVKFLNAQIDFLQDHLTLGGLSPTHFDIIALAIDELYNEVIAQCYPEFENINRTAEH